uniref:NACHT domain-containing protein n=1 Tax=Sinocyclocheilus grahami TaxID=75366 RepID=A0A672QYG1_SINGR
MFESPEQDKQVRTVLTKGVAGIGKSVSVQKFVLDWAEGKENQNISFIFPLPFREINLKEKEKQSLLDLITQFFPETKGLNIARRNQKVLFILDGLDEFRLPLKFDVNETWSDVSSPASLDVLLTNLIKGNLLPSALIWITTRPAAASKIPPDYIDRLTEVRGFSDAQKEEYFKKRFEDQNQAKEITDHVKQSKILFIMCHIPVFCWISATGDDASKTLQESNTEDTPKTLTQMYIHFLRFQILQSRRKYDGEYTPDVSWDKDAILSLGKLAFQQLERNNLIFYDTDLEACGIDVCKASVYSGMCTQIFKEETGIILGTMYCFVHLSIQEFIAALYAHLFLDINKKSVIFQDSTVQENKNEAMIDLLKTAVDKALESDNGHLDLFLRFLLGLSLQSINLFYCLNELNNQTLVKEIQTHLSKGSLSSADLSPAQWSDVAFVLLTSEEELEEFELQKFKKSDECLVRLSAESFNSENKHLVFLNSPTHFHHFSLRKCGLTEESCSALATVLRSNSSLKELDMSNNNLQDSGVKKLQNGLEDTNCALQKLRLNNCEQTEKSCSVLATVLFSKTILKEINLNNSRLLDSGVKEICEGLKNPVFLKSPAAQEACEYLTKVLGKSPLLLKELDLSEDKLGDLDGETCLVLATVLSSKTILKEINLNNSRLLDSGVKEICEGLKNPVCELKILKLSDCSITEEGYKALASALRSNPSHLIELDLTGNDPGQSGVKQLSDLLQSQYYSLKTLSLRKCGLTEESCSALATVLRSNSSLKELDLSNNNLQDSGVKKLQNGLENTNCTLQKLRLSDCSITEEGYKALASALRSNPSHLIELDLTGNDPGQSGVKQLSDLLQDPNYSLKTLR